MNYKSFVDVLFILLLGTIVMLAHSVTIGAVDTELLKIGGGGVSDVQADTVEVVVIDHDLNFITSICDRIYCLDRGTVIAEGTPDEIQADPAVQSAYLGATTT